MLSLFGSVSEVSAKVKVVPANEHGESGDAEGTYFHLYAEYQVDGSELLVFDLQISCGSHTFKEGRVVRGYLPALYAKKTASGAAVMLATPRICDAIRYAEDRKVVDKSDFQRSWQRVLDGNFIPFTIWFEDAEDLTYGFGYPVAGSFDNPASPLKFIDTKIGPSTEKAFSAWFEVDGENLLKELQLGSRFVTSEHDQAYWAIFDPAKQLLPLSCFGVAVTAHEDGASAEWVRQFYLDDRPRYWLAPESLPDTDKEGKPSKQSLVPYSSDQYYGSSPSQEFPLGFNYLRRDKLEARSSYDDDLWTIPHPDYYPAIRSDGFPFAEKGAFEQNLLRYTVDLRKERKGLLACFSIFNPIGYGTANFKELYEFYFGFDYGEKLADFGNLIDLEILDDAGPVVFEAISQPLVLPHFLISDRSVAEFVTFEFFGGGHVQ
ncbi:MAG: hypothetical protein AAGA50_24250 [Pseudomonadota bacterium]